MKIAILLLASCILSQISYAQFTSDEVKEIKKMCNGSKVQYDGMEDLIWVKSGNVNIHESNGLDAYWSNVSIYFGLKKADGKITVMPIRIVNTIGGGKWTFFNEVLIVVGTKSDFKAGTLKRYKIIDSDVKRTHDGGSKEVSDVVADESLLELIKSQSEDAKQIKVRYSGESYIEFNQVFVGGFEREFKPLLENWNLLSEKYK
jgi:hypothetical protein